MTPSISSAVGSIRLLIVTLLATAISGAPTSAQQIPNPQSAQKNPRWGPIFQVFHQGDIEGGYFRINLPRTDLRVRIDRDTLDAGVDLTSYVGFMPLGSDKTGVLAMGEIILTQNEVPATLAEARVQGVRVTALHNHLIGEVPRIIYAHLMAQGSSDAVAKKLRAVFARTATPLDPPKKESATSDWTAIDRVLGTHSEAEGRVAEYVFPRKESLRMHGMAVKSVGTLETASEVVFQKLSGGRVATAGELYLLPGEVDVVVRTLDEHGLHVSALHNHMLDDGPPHFWVHWYATGDETTLARGVAATLAHMNSAQKAVAEP